MTYVLYGTEEFFCRRGRVEYDAIDGRSPKPLCRD